MQTVESFSFSEEGASPLMTIVVPLIGYRGEVVKDWIDGNGHMGSLAYASLLHSSISVLFNAIGIDVNYVQRRQLSIFHRETHLSYEAELRLGAPIEVRSWLVAFETDRIHHFHELINLNRDRRAAAMEFLSSHVDLATRRATHFPPDIGSRLDDLAVAYAGQTLPEGHGARISLAGNDR
jgi:Predicted thioesterase